MTDGNSKFETNDWLDLLTTPLNVAEATAFVTAPAAGGIDIFLGTTRSEGNLIALYYQAYESMARKQLADLAFRAGAQWPVIRLAILHRLGRVSVGEASVLIAVSTPHRAEAFECCRWIIDELKKEVTIWKQEIWAESEPTWVHPASAVTDISRE
jgi:molybdopterin synthase catalytic subunit